MSSASWESSSSKRIWTEDVTTLFSYSQAAATFEFQLSSIHLRAENLRRAARPRSNREAEAVQFDDRSDQAQAQAQSLGIAAFIRAIESPEHRVSLGLGDAGAAVLHLDDTLAVAVL